MKKITVPASEMNSLTTSQKAAVKALANGGDLYLHGRAGSGKSYLVDVIRRSAARKGLNVFVVAPTGKAARNVEGSTIHHAFGIPIGILGPEACSRSEGSW